MFNTTFAFKNRIRQPEREFNVTCAVDTSAQLITLSKQDITQFERYFNCGDNLELGGVYPVCYELTFANPDNLYGSVDFKGSTISPVIGLKVGEAFENLAYNKGYITERSKPTSTITLTAYDALYRLNKPYISGASYPVTLAQIAQDIASQTGINLASTSFTNSTVVVTSAPDFTGITSSQVLSWIAQLAGSYVRLNAYEQIEFVWFTAPPAGLSITTGHCSKMEIDEPTVPISGIIYGDSIVGTDVNAFEIKDNFLLNNITDKATVLTAVYNRVVGTTYRPYSLNWVGDISYQPGDRIVLVDRNNVQHDTILMADTLSITGGIKCTSSAKTKTQEQKSYLGDAGIRTAQIRQSIKQLDMKVDENKTSLESAIEDVTSLMARSFNTYTFYKQAGNGWIEGMYLSFRPEENVDVATEVWVQSAAGYAHYPNGVAGAPDTGMTANGTIVAKLVSANIITADMIKTGKLQSENYAESGGTPTAGSVLNLADGSFKSKNLSWDSLGSLTAKNADITGGTIGGFTIGIVQDDGSPSNTVKRLFATGFSALEFFNEKYCGLKSCGTTFLYAGASEPLNNYTTNPSRIDAIFKVTQAGAVTCKNLTATGGTVAGWTINTDGFYGSGTKLTNSFIGFTSSGCHLELDGISFNTAGGYPCIKYVATSTAYELRWYKSSSSYVVFATIAK